MVFEVGLQNKTPSWLYSWGREEWGSEFLTGRVIKHMHAHEVLLFPKTKLGSLQTNICLAIKSSICNQGRLSSFVFYNKRVR